MGNSVEDFVDFVDFVGLEVKLTPLLTGMLPFGKVTDSLPRPTVCSNTIQVHPPTDHNVRRGFNTQAMFMFG